MFKYLYKNKIIIYLALIFIALIKIYIFYDFEHRTDQISQMGWIFNIIKSDHLVDSKIFFNINNVFQDQKGLVYEFFKPTFYSGNLHANYFHLFSILIISLISKFFFVNISNAFTFVSIVSTLIAFYLLIKILKKLYYYQLDKNFLLFITIFFILGIFNWYSLIFSPLGVHNFSSMIMVLNFYLYLNYFKKNFLFYGLIFSISALTHQLNFILLGIFYLLVIFESDRLIINKIKNFIIFSTFPIIIFFPLLIIISLNFDGYNFELANSKNSYFLNNLYFNFKFLIIKNIKLFGLIFVLSFFTFFSKKKTKFEKKIQLILFLFFVLSILNREIYTSSYHRSSIYLFYIYIILFFKFFFAYLKNTNLKKLIVILIIFNAVYNYFMVDKYKQNLSVKDDFYYYYNNQGNIKTVFKYIDKNFELKNIIFLNDLSQSYYNIYNSSKNNTLLTKPINNFLVKNDYTFIDDLKDKKINLVSFERDEYHDLILEKFYKNLDMNCKLENNFYLKEIFEISDNDFYKLRINKIYCR